jgi:hypothetical protein
MLFPTVPVQSARCRLRMDEWRQSEVRNPRPCQGRERLWPVWRGAVEPGEEPIHFRCHDLGRRRFKMDFWFSDRIRDDLHRVCTYSLGADALQILSTLCEHLVPGEHLFLG